MFNKFKNQDQRQQFMPDSHFRQIYYQLEETNRKLRNLNNRLRRVENYLGLRNDDKYDHDVFLEDWYMIKTHSQNLIYHILIL